VKAKMQIRNFVIPKYQVGVPKPSFGSVQTYLSGHYDAENDELKDKVRIYCDSERVKPFGLSHTVTMDRNFY
jgi:hypothetical protein